MPFSRRRRVRPVVVDPATGRVVSPVPFVGVGLVASSVFLYGAASFLEEAGGPLVPFWAALVLLATWVLMLVLCFVWWHDHPRRVLALGVISFGWWFAAVVAGAIVLDWTA